MYYYNYNKFKIDKNAQIQWLKIMKNRKYNKIHWHFRTGIVWYEQKKTKANKINQELKSLLRFSWLSCYKSFVLKTLAAGLWRHETVTDGKRVKEYVAEWASGKYFVLSENQ